MTVNFKFLEKQEISASAKDLTTDFFVLSSNDNSSTRNELIFRQRASDNDWEIEGVEQSTGYHNVWIKNGNLKFTSGKGIDFSATGNGSGTMSSELLDDYEEGTLDWRLQRTGAIGSGSNHSDTSITYTKVGNRVYVSGYIYTANTSNSTGVTVELRDDSNTNNVATLPYVPNQAELDFR